MPLRPPSPPYSGVRGLATPPHPRPLAPEYGGEGRKPNSGFRARTPAGRPARFGFPPGRRGDMLPARRFVPHSSSVKTAMKLVVAIIRPEKLEAVQQALNERD